MNKQKPVHELTINLVKAAIWENEKAENGTRYSVTFSRIYRPKESASWKYSESFSANDLPFLTKAADQAYSWIETHKKETRLAVNR